MRSRSVLIFLIGAFIFFICTKDVRAQRNNKRKFYTGNELRVSRDRQTSSFLSQQWYLGLIIGTNLTDPVPGTRYTTLSPIDKSTESLNKNYEKFNLPGLQAGLNFTYQYHIFNISLQPNFRRQSFAYGNQYEWVDDNNPENTLVLNYNQEHNLDYIELPLLVKVLFLQGSIRPYVGVGAYYGWLVNANKSVKVDGIDHASGGSYPFNKEALSVGATNLFISYNTGIIGAVGLNYDPGNVRLTLDIQYYYGLVNITDTANRFTDNRLAGIGDAMDDLSLNNLAINFGIMFPLRFLSNDFSSTE